MLKVLIVDDSSVFRNVLNEIVIATGIAQVTYTACDGIEALVKLKHLDIDIVMLDIVMPRLGGLETLKIIKDKYPSIKVIIVSGISGNDAKLTMEALSSGAIDFISKPSSDKESIQKLKSYLRLIFNQILIGKNTKNTLSILDNQIGYNQNKLSDENQKIKDIKLSNYKKPDIILIAASTGGPAAIDKILRCINENINIPILVVQHMPAEFTKSLAESLNKVCRLKVEEAYNGYIIEGGEVLIAPGGVNMSVHSSDNSKVIRIETSCDVKKAKPSADWLFKSVANVYKGKKVLVIVLTGMGSDGTEGVRELKELCKCYCITESQSSCVVYGMPRCLDDENLSDDSLHINDIGEMINKLTSF